MFDRQIDVFGDEHDIAPAHEGMRLFEPVRVMPGQTGMDVDAPTSRVKGDPLAAMREQLANYAAKFDSVAKNARPLGCNYCERTDTDRNTDTGRCVSGTGCNALDSETIAHGIA